LAHSGETEHVHFELPPRFVQRNVFDGSIRTVSSVVDEDVDASLKNVNNLFYEDGE